MTLPNDARPLVSVCIPSYNNEEFIAETLVSLFSQSYGNIELIVSDDGSVDRTAKIVNGLRDQSPFPLTVHVEEKNQGLAKNWNKALSMAKGEYIKILPGDDVLTPECIERQVSALTSNPDAALVFCGRKVVTRSGRHLLTARFFDDLQLSETQLIEKCVFSGTNVIGEPGAVMFPAKLAQKIGDFDDTRPYVIDLQYWFRLLEHGTAISHRALMASFRIDQNLSVKIGSSRKNQFVELCHEYALKWPVSSHSLKYGRFRAGLNEILRRIVHKVFQTVG